MWWSPLRGCGGAELPGGQGQLLASRYFHLTTHSHSLFLKPHRPARCQSWGVESPVRQGRATYILWPGSGMSWFSLSLQKGKWAQGLSDWPELTQLVHGKARFGKGPSVLFCYVYHFIIRLEALLVLTLTCVLGGELILNAWKWYLRGQQQEHSGSWLIHTPPLPVSVGVGFVSLRGCLGAAISIFWEPRWKLALLGKGTWEHDLGWSSGFGDSL